ncbi:hypothetical protein AQUCO_01900086v1, partial [Aquilegia coerulea]
SWRCGDCFLSATSLFFLSSFLLLASISTLYTYFALPHYQQKPLSSLGCHQDNQGSWSIGVFYGDSPFTLKPIESKNVWNDETSAWPIANPVITCATVSDAGFPSNFVSDPFLFVQWDTFYMFYETKNSITLQGDIGVAKSTDKGATWKHLGIAIDVEWHLSSPYVFEYENHIYLMPENSQQGELHLYRALEFPLQWTLDRVIMKMPLINSFIFNYNALYWLFGSDVKTGQLEIWYSSIPLGPWTPHEQNTVYNASKILGAQGGGRPFMYNANMYRIAQDSGGTYGRRLRTFKVEILTKDEYKEIEVPLRIEEPEKGRNTWNGARYGHLDVQQLSPNEWIGVMDGDRILLGEYLQRYILGSAVFAVVVALVILVGILLGAVKCIIPLSWCDQGSRKRSDALLTWDQSHLLPAKLRWYCTRLNRICSSLRVWMKLHSRVGRVLLTSTVIICVALMCTGVGYLYGGNGADEPHLLKGQYSQFTLLAMTYEARLWNLKMYVKHYSRCSSVKEIVVVWNKGEPPRQEDFDSAVPVRIRVENQNSLNNRFKVDPLIKTRAVLELDDDIMMACNDIERGFGAWRNHPDRIIGFYPRLIQGHPLQYRNEKFARTNKGYNMVLTGAAFIDSRTAFERYWSEEAKPGRELVDKYFNCEDVLLNYLYANASSSRTVEYVQPGWVIDMSKFSGVAISRNAKVHYQIRSNCLSKFSELYGSLGDQKWKFPTRTDG